MTQRCRAVAVAFFSQHRSCSAVPTGTVSSCSTQHQCLSSTQRLDGSDQAAAASAGGTAVFLLAAAVYSVSHACIGANPYAYVSDVMPAGAAGLGLSMYRCAGDIGMRYSSPSCLLQIIHTWCPWPSCLMSISSTCITFLFSCGTAQGIMHLSGMTGVCQPLSLLHHADVTAGALTASVLVGLMVGPAMLGCLADMTTVRTALGANAILLLACALFFHLQAREPRSARPQAVSIQEDAVTRAGDHGCTSTAARQSQQAVLRLQNSHKVDDQHELPFANGHCSVHIRVPESDPKQLVQSQ